MPDDYRTRLLYWLGGRCDRLARHLTYRGGERSPRWMVERLADRLTWAGAMRYRAALRRMSRAEFEAYVQRRYGGA